MKRSVTSTVLFVLMSVASHAQTGSTAPPASALPPPPVGTKVATISMQDAIGQNNEGRRDFEELAKKFEPRRAELQKLNSDIEDLKKQLTAQGDKLTDEARDVMVKSIETMTKSLQRSAEDNQSQFQQQQNEIAQRILQKLAPVITKYVTDKGYGLLLDSSAPWPQGLVVMAGPAFDITKAIVDAYNAQSAVPSTATTGAATGAAKPASTTPGAAKPATTQSTPPARPATATAKPN
jgi:outer membrane protein